MSRSVASPDAETPSYWPVFMSATISSDVLPILTLTLQPVCDSNGCTQSTLGSSEPSSAYPAQAMMLSAPSPAPTDFCTGTFGSFSPPDLELLHAATRHSAAAIATAGRVMIMLTPIDFTNPERRPGAGSM